jgi:ornithine cyclodeaminase
VKIVSVEALAELVERHGFDNYMRELIKCLREDFGRWNEFTKMPRPAMHVPGGVIELMPVCDDTYYTFKYVNGHPGNPATGKMTVLATGQISRVRDGYPLMISEMTLLTGLRTAATSALATDLMARKDAKVLAIIGTGAQSEFQVRAARLVRDIKTVRYFDTDPKAMDKFERNMAGSGLELVRCSDAEEAVRGADVITVVTACKAHVDVIKNDWVKPGVHINGLGGDCPGKTELEASILPRAQVVVEYFDQSHIEGEIQRWSEAEAREMIVGELHELVTGKKARHGVKDITLFDSVGIALEDYSALRLTYELVQKYEIGEELDMTPPVGDPKDLVSLLGRVPVGR